MLNNIHSITDIIISQISDQVKFACDLTVGNGKDSLKIANECQNLKKLFCFDIQEVAIINSKKLLGNFNDKVIFIQDSHSNIKRYIDIHLDLIIMNLGFLPNHDKKICTNFISTLEAIKHSLELLSKNGVFIIAIYPGHNEGMEEKVRISNFVQDLDQREYNIVSICFPNQVNNPPELIIIEKR